MRGSKEAQAECLERPGDHCFENDCPTLKTCPELAVSPHKYPVVQPRKQCQYRHADGSRCRRTSYYLIPIQNKPDEYRCILDCPWRYRQPQFKIRTIKNDRPLR
jgi:hypothetical protein